MLQDKTAIVTGAGSGIGHRAAVRFATEGAHVVVVDLDADAANAVAGEIGGTAVAGSVADLDTWAAAIDVADDRGGVDVAYLNAGLYGFFGPIDELPVDLYHRTIAANIDGVVLGTRAVVGAMKQSGGGAIVVTASVAGIVAFEPNPVYTLTKHAVAGFVRAVAASLTPHGISIDAVCPGAVDTPMTDYALGGASRDVLDLDLISPDDIADAAFDLATTEGTGRCRAVRADGTRTDWVFPTFVDLAKAPAN